MINLNKRCNQAEITHSAQLKGQIMKKRIMVIGCSGSGKSTFSRRLGEITGIPVCHLDKLFWKNGWVQEDREVFKEKQLNVIQTDKWIIDGHYMSTMEKRLERADLIFFFKIGRIKCITGVIKRVISYRNKTRPDMGEGCNEKIDWEFIKFIWNFNKIQQKKADNLLKSYPHIKIITFHSRKQADHYLKGAAEYVGK